MQGLWLFIFMKQLILSQTENEKRKLIERAFRQCEVLNDYYFVNWTDPERVLCIKDMQASNIAKMLSDPDWYAFCVIDCYDYYPVIAGGKNED